MFSRLIGMVDNGLQKVDTSLNDGLVMMNEATGGVRKDVEGFYRIEDAERALRKQEADTKIAELKERLKPKEQEDALPDSTANS